MEKIKEFATKYKIEIVTVLGALITIATSLMTLGGEYAIVFGIVVVVLGIILEVFQHGLTDKAVSLLTEAIMMIIEIKQNTPTDVVGAENKETLEAEIKERLLKSLK